MVRFNTISDQSNLPLIECIADHLRGLGIPMRLTYDDDKRKANLFATLGSGKPGGVVLSGHTDTVPWEGQAWSMDPLSAEVRDFVRKNAERLFDKLDKEEAKQAPKQ